MRFVYMTALVLIFVFASGVGLSSSRLQQDGAPSGSSKPQSDDVPKELPGLHNVHRATTKVLLGSEPHGEEAFQQLQKLGVKAIVSVDGATPEVQLARKYGIRYIHIPIGYDAVSQDAALALARVAREVDVPVYVHCHHGRHRGPAAAAVLCLSNGSLTHAQAVELMKSAGTGKDYTGLWRDVKAFQPPSKDVKLPELLEVAKVESLAAAMAKLDRAFDHVKLCAKSDWKTPADHPDLLPATEARLVQEGLHESLRHCTGDHPEEFRNWLKQSDELAEQLCKAIQDSDTTRASSLMKSLEAKCAACHVAYRN